MKTMLKAPFSYFGGKSQVADIVWTALGQPKHYIEPFFGSGAVLLSRPDWQAGMIETVNDSDGFLSNVWRSLQFSPDETAKWCDWPVNHADLSARKRELLKNEKRLLDGLNSDPKWHDPVLGGYWIWAASCWIGSGLTRLGQIPRIGNSGKGVHKLGGRPHLSDSGMGVHKLGKIPHISNSGKGVNKLGGRPHLSNSGMGVHKLGQIPHIGHGGKGVQEPYNTNIYSWFRALSERLRYVRVVCGDWSRVCGGDWQDKVGDCGIFFDPPYAVNDRDDEIYHHDSVDVAHDVREWCVERGDKPSYRIVLAGYDEHDELTAHGWRKESWTAKGGYGNLGKGQGSENRKRETLWFSPACLDMTPKLFKYE